MQYILRCAMACLVLFIYNYELKGVEGLPEQHMTYKIEAPNGNPPIHVTVNNANNIPISMNTEVQQGQYMQQYTRIYNWFADGQMKLQGMYPVDVAKTFVLSINNYIRNHKMRTTLTLIAGSYASTLCMLVYYDLYLMFRTNTWACWKGNVPFDVLITIPYDHLSQDLLLTIQQKYQSTQAFTDFLRPLIRFLHDINTEIATLSHFMTLHKWLSIARMTIFFPKQEKWIEEAREKLKRVAYLREIFLRWAAEYKITLNNASNQSIGVSKRALIQYRLASVLRRSFNKRTKSLGHKGSST